MILKSAKIGENMKSRPNISLVNTVVGGAVTCLGSERSSLHLLKAEGESAAGITGLYDLLGHHEGRRTRGAVVVDIEHRDPTHAHLIQGPLSTSRVSCANTQIMIRSEKQPSS